MDMLLLLSDVAACPLFDFAGWPFCNILLQIGLVAAVIAVGVAICREERDAQAAALGAPKPLAKRRRMRR